MMSAARKDDEEPVSRQTYSMDEVAKLLGVSRMQAYRAARRGDFPTIRVGEKLLVAPRKPIQRLLCGDSA
jgi:excisionase family DNA binding protein